MPCSPLKRAPQTLGLSQIRYKLLCWAVSTYPQEYGIEQCILVEKSKLYIANDFTSKEMVPVKSGDQLVDHIHDH